MIRKTRYGLVTAAAPISEIAHADARPDLHPAGRSTVDLDPAPTRSDASP